VVEDVEVACDRVIVFARGKIVFDGVPLDLAGAAAGKVWSMVTAADEQASHVPEDAVVVDQVPGADGLVRLRILHDGDPGHGSDSTPPTLQDGYLWLVGSRRSA